MTTPIPQTPVTEAPSRSRHGGLTLLLYITFAAISVACNLGSQWLVAHVLGAYSLLILELAVGTGVGVVVRFPLDRTFIFDGGAQTKPVAQQAGLYLGTGLITTLIFWCGEGFSVWWLGKSDTVDRHLCGAGTVRCVEWLGAVNTHLVVGAITLAACYVLKYQLDKRITFA